MTRCAIYIRRSKKDKNNPGHRLEYQRKMLPEYAHSQRWNYKVFDEGMRSAKDIKDLPKLNEILAQIKQFDVILAIEYTRFSRDASAQDYIWFLSKCMEAGIKLATPQSFYDTTDPLQWFALYQAGGFSAKEMQDLSKRIKQGRIVSQDKGKWMGGMTPFGYKYNPLVRKLVLERKEANLLMRIFQYLVDHSMAETVRKFAKHKTKERVPIDSWWILKISSPDRLYQYAGYRRNTKGEYIPANHPAIISNKLRLEILSAKAKRHREGAGFFGFKTIFGGLKILRCGYCGKPIILQYVKRLYLYTQYYKCSTKNSARTANRCAKSRYYQCPEIDEILIRDLVKKFQDIRTVKREYKKFQQFKSRPADSKIVMALSNRLEEEENTKKILVDALGSRLQNDEDVITRIEEVKRTIYGLQRQLDEHTITPKLPFNIDELKARAKEIEEFRSFDRDKKRMIIKLAIRQIRFFRDYLEVDYTFLKKKQKINLK